MQEFQNYWLLFASVHEAQAHPWVYYTIILSSTL